MFNVGHDVVIKWHKHLEFSFTDVHRRDEVFRNNFLIPVVLCEVCLQKII